MRTESTTFTARIGETRARVFLSVEESPKGEPTGFTLEGHLAEDPAFSCMISITAKACSIALREGTSLKEIVDLLIGTTFTPKGKTEGCGRVTYCRSVYDWAGKLLAIHYLGRDDLANQPPEVHEGSTD